MKGDAAMEPHHFLNLHFLKWTKPASTSLHMQRALAVVRGACVLVGAIRERRELLVSDVLEDFGAAAVTRVGIDKQ